MRSEIRSDSLIVREECREMYQDRKMLNVRRRACISGLSEVIYLWKGGANRANSNSPSEEAQTSNLQQKRKAGTRAFKSLRWP
jgi:hypothetical protein